MQLRPITGTGQRDYDHVNSYISTEFIKCKHTHLQKREAKEELSKKRHEIKQFDSKKQKGLLLLGIQPESEVYHLQMQSI